MFKSLKCADLVAVFHLPLMSMPEWLRMIEARFRLAQDGRRLSSVFVVYSVTLGGRDNSGVPGVADAA